MQATVWAVYNGRQLHPTCCYFAAADIAPPVDDGWLLSHKRGLTWKFIPILTLIGHFTCTKRAICQGHMIWHLASFRAGDIASHPLPAVLRCVLQ